MAEADWAVRADRPEAEAMVIGCSALRACQASFLDPLEAERASLRSDVPGTAGKASGDLHPSLPVAHGPHGRG